MSIKISKELQENINILYRIMNDHKFSILVYDDCKLCKRLEIEVEALENVLNFLEELKEKE